VVKAEKNLEMVHAKDRGMWRAWLEKHHRDSPGVRLAISKKKRKKHSVSYEEAVEEAICFGWIDSRANRLDDDQFILLLSPRKAKSLWSSSNKQRVEKLIHQGLMTPAGLEKVEAAKQDGSWYTIDGIEALTIPVDLQEALDHNAHAKKNFNAFSNSSKKMILYWIESAKHHETRTKRIQHTVSLAAQNMKPYQ
jgi:uncharacterized protein YdeI (YjbR/CyaY-like superfamily)